MRYEVAIKVVGITGNLFAHPIRRDDLQPVIFQFHFSDDEAPILCGAFVDLPFELPVLNDVTSLSISGLIQMLSSMRSASSAGI